MQDTRSQNHMDGGRAGNSGERRSELRRRNQRHTGRLVGLCGGIVPSCVSVRARACVRAYMNSCGRACAGEAPERGGGGVRAPDCDGGGGGAGGGGGGVL